MSKKNKKKQQQQTAQSKTEQTGTDIAAGQNKSRLWTILLLSVTFILFFPSLSHKLVNWDDHVNLYENKALNNFANQWNWEDVKTIFTTDVSGTGNYNPLPVFTFAVEKYFFASDPEASPFIFHFTNVLLHLICTFLVFLLFQKLGLALIPAFFGALLFGIHPMRVESVAWVTERKDVLFGLFFVASLITYLRYAKTEKQKTRWYLITLGLSLFSYFSKIQAVTLPLSMVALDFFMGRKWYSFKVLVMEKLPWWGLSLAIGLINIHYLNLAQTLSASTSSNFQFIDKLAIGAFSYFTYLVKFIYPYTMAPIYGYPTEIPALYYILLAAIPLAIVFFLIRAWKKGHKHAIFAWAFFTFNVMFLLQIVSAGQAFLADRFTYIAYMGLFFFVAYGIAYFIKKKPAQKNLIYGIAGVYALLCSVLTFQQVKVWENSGTLWNKEIEEFPNVPDGFLYEGQYIRDELKNFPLAKQHFLKVVEMKPDGLTGHQALGKLYFDMASSMPKTNAAEKTKLKQVADSATLQFNIALHLDSAAGNKNDVDRSEMFINRAACRTLIEDYDAALKDYATGISLNPENENGYANRAYIYINTNQNQLALKDFDSYLLLRSDNAAMFYQRAVCKYKMAKYEDALKDVNTAFSLGDEQPLYYLGRAEIYKSMNNFDAMRKDAVKARDGGINVPEYLLK